MIDVEPIGAGPLEVTGGQITIVPTHPATGVIDPAARTAALYARGSATAAISGSLAFVPFDATCQIGSVDDPIELSLSTEPLGPDAPVPYDQATGTATLVGELDFPVSTIECSPTGDGLESLLNDAYHGRSVMLAARYSPALHAPGFGAPAPVVSPPPAGPGAGTPLPVDLLGPPRNVFELDRLRVSSSNGVVTLVLRVPGPGTVSALSTANVGKAAAARRIRVARVKRTVKRAGAVTLKLKPSKAAKRVLRRKAKLRARVKITYTPTGGAPRSLKRAITLKRKPKRR